MWKFLLRAVTHLCKHNSSGERKLPTNIFNGTIASGTSGTELIVVVFFAVSFTVSKVNLLLLFKERQKLPFEEVPLSKFSAALAAHVVLRVPHFAERDDDLADNGFSTSSAIALGDRRDAMLAAVLAVQRAQHRIGVRRVSRRRSTLELQFRMTKMVRNVF